MQAVDVPGGDVYSARRDVTEPDVLVALDRCYRVLNGVRRLSNGSGLSHEYSPPAIARLLKRSTFEEVKHRMTRRDHNLIDVIWPSLNYYRQTRSQSTTSQESMATSHQPSLDCTEGIVAPDYESYVVFHEVFDPVIRQIHNLSGPCTDLPDHPESRFFKVDDIDVKVNSYNIDPSSKYVLNITLHCCRNLKELPFPNNLSINQLENIEQKIMSEIVADKMYSILTDGKAKEADSVAGTYYTVNEVLDNPENLMSRLQMNGLLLLDEYNLSSQKHLHGRHWPYGRGVFVNTAEDIAIWINVQDHIRVICHSDEEKPGMIGIPYVKIAKVMMALDETLEFIKDPKLGYLSPRPSSLGNTLIVKLLIRLPELSKDLHNLDEICTTRGLTCSVTEKKHTFVVQNCQTVGVTEIQSLKDLLRAVLSVIKIEKELSVDSSLTISSFFTNMFKRTPPSKDSES